MYRLGALVHELHVTSYGVHSSVGEVPFLLSSREGRVAFIQRHAASIVNAVCGDLPDELKAMVFARCMRIK